MFYGPIDGDPKNLKALQHSIKTYYGEGVFPRPRKILSDLLYRKNEFYGGGFGILSASCPPDAPCIGCSTPTPTPTISSTPQPTPTSTPQPSSTPRTTPTPQPSSTPNPTPPPTPQPTPPPSYIQPQSILGIP